MSCDVCVYLVVLAGVGNGSIVMNYMYMMALINDYITA